MDWQNDADFCALYPDVLHVEGGFVLNPPNDPGGATNMGIAFNANQGALQQFAIYHPWQMANLTKDQALQIYYQKYWTAAQCQSLHDRKLQLIHFDAAVNHGVGAARLFKLQIHTVLGKEPEWLEGNGKNPDFFWRAYVLYLNQRINGYTHYANRATYLEGWMNRLEYINGKALNLP